VNAALDEVCCASLPPGVLPALAGLRARAGVRAREVGGRVWVWWTAGDEAVLQRVLPLPGAELFARSRGAAVSGSGPAAACRRPASRRRSAPSPSPRS
jgi:hypothetical protein